MRLLAFPRLALVCAAVALAAVPLDASGEAPSRSAETARPSSTSSATGTKPKQAARARARKAAPAKKRVSVVRKWHAPVPGKAAPLDEDGKPMLSLVALNTNERLEIPARAGRGGFSAEDLDHAAHLLRDPRTGNEHPIEPRLLDLVYRVQAHFGAHELRVISAYRTPRRGAGSNHAKGRAIDLIVPGASDDAVARFVRAQGFVGVGVYPVSGFLHLDVRERSYFWVDRSGPGKRSRLRAVLGDLAKKSDAEAAARGEHSVGPFRFTTDVDGAFASSWTSGDTSAAPAGDDEDELDGAHDP
jgi:uncharacterized protein YcbK (DUF882 family)